jgi:hypothetical protein
MAQRKFATKTDRNAALIKKVYEVDPLECPSCGGRMRIISFIEKRDQAAIIKKILKHCGLWTDTEGGFWHQIT